MIESPTTGPGVRRVVLWGTCDTGKPRVRILIEGLRANGVEVVEIRADPWRGIEDKSQVKGIGRWSAEIYLLFAEGRPDIWPAGDLAVQAGLGRILDLPERPDEKKVRDMAESWRPHRGAIAILTWHCYNNPAL